MIDVGTIEWRPLIPWLWLAALCAASLALVAYGAFARARGWLMRALALALLLGGLANPSWVEETRDPLKDIAVILVDRSASQDIGQRRAETDRALGALENKLALLPDTEMRVIATDDSENPAAVDRPDEGTRLFNALQRGLADVPARRLAGIIALSDGEIHDVPKDLDHLPFDAPFHLLLTGRPDESDRRLTIVKAPTYGIVGQKFELDLRVDDLPANTGPGSAHVSVRRDGVEAAAVDAPAGAVEKLELELDHAGPTVFEIEAAAGPAELTMANNRAVVVVNGVRDRLRVLLVSGEPHPGERTWRNLLKADPSVDLVHFTILRPPEKQDGTPIKELSLIAFPIRELFELKLDQFDLLIFDRYRQRGILPTYYYDKMAEYVRNGGALLEAVGPSYATTFGLYNTPLGASLPAEPTGEIFEQGFKPKVTDIGRRHPVTADLPGEGPADGTPEWGRWFRQIDVDAKRGLILMAGVEDRPLLILDRVGKGRVAQILSDHIWLWSRGYEGGGPQNELLRRLAHWLMKEPDLEEEDIRAELRAGRIEITRRSLEDKPSPVELTSPSGAKTILPLEPVGDGRFRAAVPARELGLYRVSDGTRTAFAASGALNPVELADVRATPEILAPVIKKTGGFSRWLVDGGVPELRKVHAQPAMGGTGWLGLRANRDYLVSGVREAPLLPSWLAVFLMIGGLILAWQREGR